MCVSREIGRKLLTWYDVNARELPWRVPPGALRKPDPYVIWLSEIMLQQTNVTTVIPYFAEFTTRWPDVMALARAEDADVLAAWAGLGYYARARNLLKCARMVADSGGRFPQSEAGLLALPGVGPYTAAAIAAIAFGTSCVVVDGNIERVMARLYNEMAPLPTVKPVLKERALGLVPAQRAGDHAQALMDLGATICTPKNPRCSACPLQTYCAGLKAGKVAELPKRLPKKPKPLRRGIVYFAMREDGHVLLETRPPHGLLGGMLGLVGSEWLEVAAEFSPPFQADWQRAELDIRHVFTHFNLALTVYATRSKDQPSARGSFVPPVAAEDLPSIMRKAYLAGLKMLS